MFSTTQKPDEIYVLKNDGQMQSFDPSKLLRSLQRSGADRELADLVMSEIGKSIKNGMRTTEIYRLAFTIMHKHQKKQAYRYSIRKAVADLGPTGFGFEKFVAEIFKAKGYQTLTDQNVRGKCVEHEVDLVAWDDVELLMAEVKFHNDAAMKSDVKVALYVKARYEDIAAMTYDSYGKPGRRISEGWLITNTKFSQAAIDFGMCTGSGLKLVSWNFPPVSNLHNMIEITGTIPITVLTTLTMSEKQGLISKGIVLCKQITKPEDLLSIGIKADRMAEIINEAKEIHQII
ncbi:MAG: YraN family protein [bacterium]